MIQISIPGRGDIKVKHAVFDVNGTIARDGAIDGHTKDTLKALARLTGVYLLTADTYGTIETEMGGAGIVIKKVSTPDEDKQKAAFIDELGAQDTIAIGNGANDRLMLKTAALGICVIAEEGASTQAMESADIVVFGRDTVFGLLENPKRIAATLRK